MNFSPELQALLNAATDKANWSSIMNNALGTSKRVRFFDGATECRNVAMANTGVTTGNGGVFLPGAFSNNTAVAGSSLAAGNGTVRIEGGGHTITLTLGLTGSGKELILGADLPANGAIGNSGITLVPPATLPNAGGGGGGGIEALQIQFGPTGSPQTVTIVEQVYSGMSVGHAGATQSRWRANPITVPAWTRNNSGVESLTGGTITFDIFPGIDSDGRADVWILARGVYDAAGTWSGGAPMTASNRHFAKIDLKVTLNGVAQTLWDGTDTYSVQFPRATSMRWQSQFVACNVTPSYVSQLITTGKLMRHNSDAIVFGQVKGTDSNYVPPDNLAYKPFKQFGANNNTLYCGDIPRQADSGGERASIGVAHEWFARLAAEVGTHGSTTFATTARLNTLKNIAEVAAQIAIAGGVLSTDYRLIDPGGDPDGPFCYAADNWSTFVAKLFPLPGATSVGYPADPINMYWDPSHVPNLMTYYAYQFSKDPWHLFLTQAQAAAAVGSTTLSGDNRGVTDGRLNVIAGSQARAHWWGLKTLAEAWGSTPSGTMPVPFRDKAWFATCIENTLTRIRTKYINNTSTYENIILNYWGTVEYFYAICPSDGVYRYLIHSLGADYAAYALSHMKRIGYPGFDDLIQYVARTAKTRAQAGGEYYNNDSTLNGVGIIAAPGTGPNLPYSTPAGWVAWYPPTGDKPAGNPVPFSRWYTARQGGDGGNYTFLFINTLACFKNLAALGVTFDWDPAAEHAALVAQLGTPTSTSFPLPWIKHNYDY